MLNSAVIASSFVFLTLMFVFFFLVPRVLEFDLGRIHFTFLCLLIFSLLQ